MSDAQKTAVKKVAEDLLVVLKKEKLVLDWRKEQSTRAAVQVTVKDVLDRLPDAYTRQWYADKCEVVYQHIYDSYWGRRPFGVHDLS